MRNKKTIFLILILPLLTASCSFYKPAKISSPFFSKKGELNFGASIGRSADLNLSYSPINNVGIIANYSNGFNASKKTHDSLGVVDKVIFNYPNHQYELGIGGYKLFDNNFYLDAYLGYGKGTSASSVLNFSLLYDRHGYRADFDNLFLQCTIGGKNSSGLCGGLLLKYNQLNFYNFSGSFDTPPSPNYFDVKQTFVIQSNMVFKYQPDLIGFEFQTGFNLANRERYFSSRMINIMLGINLKIG